MKFEMAPVVEDDMESEAVALELGVGRVLIRNMWKSSGKSIVSAGFLPRNGVILSFHLEFPEAKWL